MAKVQKQAQFRKSVMEKIYFYTFEKKYYWFRSAKACLNAAVDRAHTEFGGDEGEYSDDNNQLQFMEVGEITSNIGNQTMEIHVQGHLKFVDVPEEMDPEKEGMPTVIVAYNFHLGAKMPTWQKGQNAQAFFDG